MLLLLVVAAYTALVLLVGPRLAAGRAWTSSAPRLGLLLCQAVVAAAVSGVLVMAAMTAVSVQHLRADVGHLLHACAVAVWDNASHPGLAGTTAIGLTALALLTHLCRTGASSAAASRRVRREQLSGLALLGEQDTSAGYTRLPSEHAFAYCLPGAGGRIVVSTAAERDLDAEELHAVLAHERAHLRGRHHALVHAASVLAKALPLASVRALHEEVGRLVELAADDSACRETGRDPLLTALVRLGSAGRQVPGLAANGASTVARALRLADVDAPPPPTAASRAAVLAAAASIVATPWLLGAIPLALALSGHCDL